MPSGNRFKHPDAEAEARVITRGRPARDRPHTLWFNFVSKTTPRWQDPQLCEQYEYAVAGADSADRPGAVITL